MVAIDSKSLVSPRSADKVMYYYKLFNHDTGNTCHVLGTQGASSGTNTATLGTTQTKTVNIKETGSINQQRVVNVVMTDGHALTDVARDLYYTWEHHEQMLLYRVDWNTLRTENGKQVVNAEMSVVIISALPETEALNTAIAQNVTFEVQGIARRYDDDGNPFTLGPEDFDNGMFSDIMKYYNFAKPSEIGVDDSGKLFDNTDDDSHKGDASYGAGLNPASGSSSSSASASGTTSSVASPSSAVSSSSH